MHTLRTGNTSIEINELGTIDKWSDNPLVSNVLPVYLVFFRDYSRNDPFCKLFELISPMTNICASDNTISYRKKIEDLSVLCRISVLDGGFDWSLEIDDPYPRNLRFGITAPYCSDSYFVSLGKLLSSEVAVYYRSLADVFRDQHLLTTPLVSTSSVTVFGPPDRNSQFFTYKAEGVSCIRSTGISSVSPNIEFSLRKSTPNNAIDFFLGKYP